MHSFQFQFKDSQNMVQEGINGTMEIILTDTIIKSRDGNSMSTKVENQKFSENAYSYLKLSNPNVTYQCSSAGWFSLLPTLKIPLWKRPGLLPTVLELEKSLLTMLCLSAP
ncbi:hypothetical protein NPIL_670151 [Nephila pilipes]|uniref:Uncharacterized protein n=1 Tax=Nephila pilipes TaxID=299642 RepID=A0A8X6R004_NEPPI|nr:hypothetical protein NPIL_670151 [Nephila pilipes]